MIQAHPHARKNACLAPEAGAVGVSLVATTSLFLSLHLNRQDRRQQSRSKKLTAFQQLEPRT